MMISHHDGLLSCLCSSDDRTMYWLFWQSSSSLYYVRSGATFAL